jgi:hypothetical protein
VQADFFAWRDSPPLTCNADHRLELESDLKLIEGLARHKAMLGLAADVKDNGASARTAAGPASCK